MSDKQKPSIQINPIIYLDTPEPDPDKITLGGVKPIGVSQHADDGELLGAATVQVSRSTKRKPRYVDEEKVYRHAVRRFETTIFPNMPGYKYCSACGEWVSIKGYSPNTGNKDGLQSWCKECRAQHARYMYWQQKNTAPAKAA